ncbi:hypothetical protein CEXT_235561 [Caerostris extrusa]|uniref:Uncharacterized protein n=1 Tax=Caerostris extrusa TaxID=172846 RepID=A0AAV4UJR6_CAEEX|nr:hypothetical protein CEXT_235561 [Caerostris extrusa]
MSNIDENEVNMEETPLTITTNGLPETPKNATGFRPVSPSGVQTNELVQKVEGLINNLGAKPWENYQRHPRRRKDKEGRGGTEKPETLNIPCNQGTTCHPKLCQAQLKGDPG